MQTTKKKENRGRPKGFRLHSYTNCSGCNVTFNDNNYCSKGLCKRCYNSSYRSKNTPVTNYNRDYYLAKQFSNLLSKDECYRWVAKCYDNKFFIDMKGISDLIYVYDSLGGSQQVLDDMKPGFQLQKMWNYVNNKFLKEFRYRNM